MDFCEVPRWQLLKKEIDNKPPLAFRDALQREDHAVVIDVRTLSEVQGGTIPGARHIDYFDAAFLDKLESLDRNLSYYLICRTGRRSLRTGILMKNWGFHKIVNLEGGLTAWLDEFSTFKI